MEKNASPRHRNALSLRHFFRRLAVTAAACCAVLLTTIGYFSYTLPDRYQVTEGDSLRFAQRYLSGGTTAGDQTVSANQSGSKSGIKLFGLFPIKSVAVQNTEERLLIPSGDPFGVKMFTQGAMVVGITGIPTDNGEQSPGKAAGIEEGDLILKVNNKEISRNAEVALLIENSDGKALHFTLKRGEKTVETTLAPVRSSADGKYKSGVWIRDSAAGIGTITYIDPSSNAFAGLGHAICDVDTGQILPVGSGEVCEVSIHRIQKGKAGTPGELMGAFTANDAIGAITHNDNTGIYGELFGDYSAEKTYPLAHKQEVQLGKATIRSTLQDDEPKEYDITITSLDYNEKNEVKNMVIQVVDEELLAQTGGIVQGMSGTPILQNGKFVGAITHVFVNNPEKGYGIFAENMVAKQE